MKINETSVWGEQFDASMLIFAIVGVQIGVGIAGFQRIIYQEAKQDSWISVLLAAVCVQLVLFMMVKTLQTQENADLYGIHTFLFGKWLAIVPSTLYIVYLLLAFSTVLMDYIFIVKVWVFPNISQWQLALMLISLTVYGVLGGVRVVIGVSFIVFFGTVWMILLLFELAGFLDFSHFLPVFQASPMELVTGAFQMSLTVLGFEVIYFLYPYVKNKRHVMLYSQVGAFMSHCIMFIVMGVSIAYFSSGQLEKTVWATLTMFKIIRFPNIERFEMMAVSIWMMVILPNLLLFMWSALRGMKRVFHVKEKWSVFIIMPVVFGLVLYLNDAERIIRFTDFVSYVGFFMTFLFPIVIFLLTILKKKWMKKGSSQ